MVWPEPRAGVLRLEVADSTLELPVRPADPADDRLPPLGDPWRPLLEADRRTDPAFDRIVGTAPDGTINVTNQIDSGAVRVRSTGVTVRTAAHDVATIREADPLTARMESERRVELLFPGGESIAVTGNLVLTSDAATYRLEGTLTAIQSGSVVAQREFDQAIARSREE
jgi:hypothetical protein